jgi:hypothetical protein
MKKILILLTILCINAKMSQAQHVFNPGFENLNSDNTLQNWGNVYLTSVWIDSLGNNHSDSIISDGPFYAPVNDPYSGSHALELRNAFDFTTGHAISGAVGIDDDSIFSGYSSFNTVPTYATPFNSFAPFNFGFYYMFEQVNGDTAFAEIMLFDSSGNQVGGGLLLITDTTSSYTLINAPINYYSSDLVAFYSFRIGTFYSIEPGSHEPSLGTRLKVDNIGFNYVSAYVSDFNGPGAKMIYPNPASDFVNVDISVKNNSAYKIYSSTGQIIKSGKLKYESKEISISDLQDGLYFIECETGNDYFCQPFVKVK